MACIRTGKRMLAVCCLLGWALATNADAQHYRYYCPEECPPVVAPRTTEGSTQDSAAADMITPNDANLLADTTSTTSVASAVDSAGVGMIGDHPQGFGRVYRTSGFGLFDSQISTGAGDRLFKIAENTNPEPASRVFFLYNHFENTSTISNQAGDESQLDVDRITLGIERAFCLLGVRSSVEVRLPILLSGLNADQGVGRDDLTGGGLGNVGLAFKVALWDSGCTLVSGGVAVMLPTGKDGRLFDNIGPVLTLKNEAVHLAPFVGFRRLISDRLFVTGVGQVDFDLNGNQLVVGNNVATRELNDASLLLLSGQAGYWLYESCDSCSLLSRVAGLVELHYTDSMSRTDAVDFGGGNTVGEAQSLNALNLSAALHFQIGQKSTLRVASVNPIKSENQRFFDSELLVQFNRFF